MAHHSLSKAHYFQKELAAIGLELTYDQPFFHEFVTSVPNAQVILDCLDKANILGGYPLDEHHLLWCVTEKVSKQTLDDIVLRIKEVLHG